GCTRMTQWHGGGTERAVRAAALAALARLLQRGGGGANASRTHRLRGALELVRDRGQLRNVASARGNVDIPLCLNCCFTEFPQQRINGRAVVPEPRAKHVPVDCRGGLPLV